MRAFEGFRRPPVPFEVNKLRQLGTLSRRQHGFKSRRGRQLKSKTYDRFRLNFEVQKPHFGAILHPRIDPLCRRSHDHAVICSASAVTIAGIELAKKIKKDQFKIGKLIGRPTTAAEIWTAILAA